MKLHAKCEHCHGWHYIMECSPHTSPYAANVDCDLCGGETAFVISYPINKEPVLLAVYALEEDEYLCPECFNVYNKGRTDEEALEVARRRLNSPDLELSDTELVCEDCFNEIVIPKLN